MFLTTYQRSSFRYLYATCDALAAHLPHQPYQRQTVAASVSRFRRLNTLSMLPGPQNAAAGRRPVCRTPNHFVAPGIAR